MGFFGNKNKRVFLDFASATPTRSEVFDVMAEYTQKHFANPSALYVEARATKEIMQKARAEVGEFLNCAKERIVFTSGGTEANNIALLGVFENAKKRGVSVPHIISVLTEHPSSREVLDEIKNRGGEVTLLTPNKDGLIQIEQVVDAIKENTVLVSVMYVNNEIGVTQPVKDIAQEIKKYRKDKNSNYPYFHTDACQAALFYTLDVSTLGVDLLTLDGLKVYGPHGVGCLYVKNGLEISPILFGGGQENGLRSGTEHVASMIGLAKALSLAKVERKELSERVEKLREYCIDEIVRRCPDAQLNGSRKYRAPNNINICFSGLDSEYLVVALDTYGVSASYSSSCRTLKEDSSSYVVEALDKVRAEADAGSVGSPTSVERRGCARSSIRFTLGRETTRSDIDFALEALEKAITQVQRSV